MNAWSELNVENMDPEVLAQEIRTAGRPVHINVLARVAVQAQLEAKAKERRYAPGAKYAQGETIRFNGQPVMVKAVQTANNPKQGQFTVLTLTLPDGSERYMVAEVAGAPAQDREPVSEERVRAVVGGENGLAIRTAVQEALNADDRFVWFQDAQGDHWCLAEMLPEVTDEDLAKIWPLLQGLLADNTIHPRPTEELVRAIWDQENDGSDAYALKAFALNAALQRCQEARWLGNGWVLEAEWQRLQERPVLMGPRQENVVEPPPGVTVATEDEQGSVGGDEGAESEAEESAAVVEGDLEAWRRNRRLNAELTLRASHYYGNWLPLTRDMRRVFPPLASESYGVTFYHRFGGQEASFPAWVDWSQGRILGSPQMYQAFYEHGVYPGAKLVVSHRGNLWEYDIRTKPVEGERRLRVRRVFLSEGGELEYEEIEEPLRYQVDSDVFIAAARWEDLPALFRQAEEVGAGIFQLMYQQCCQWWEEGGRRPLYVTAQQLFEAIHYDDQGRMTSKATIAWELWRRQAFESAGEGRYLFRPEKADRVRSIELRRRTPKSPVVRVGPKVRRDRSLRTIVRRVCASAESPHRKAETVEKAQKGEGGIWPKIAQLVGQQISPLDRGEPFQVSSINDREVVLVLGTGSEWRPPRSHIERAWAELTSKGTVKRTWIRDEISEYNASYIVALLAALPGVRHQVNPIQLFYGGSEDEAAVWKAIETLQGRTLYTLAQHKPFTVARVTADVIELKAGPEGERRAITRSEALAVWQALTQEGELPMAAMTERKLLKFLNESYMAAILAALPGVTYRTQPVRLFYRKEAEPEAIPESPSGEEPPQALTVERRRDGQLVVVDLVPTGPLLELRPEADDALPEPVHPEPELPEGPPPSGKPPSHQPPASVPRPRSREDETRSKTLFSRHYLNTRLPNHPEWAEDPRPTFEVVRALWQKARQYGQNWNEAQTEEEFVKPMLKALGWAFTVQPKAKKGGRITRPDYALFGSDQAKAEADRYLGQDDPFYNRALAIAEAKYWGRPLSQKDTSGRNTWKVGSNPSHQMVSYLVGTRVPWGILTNGRTWRLYSREVSSTASEFYEVDLGLVFDFLPDDAEPSPVQLDQFRRWWLFFRRDAFVPDAQGKSFVQRVHEGSATYAREISDKLKELVFEQVIPEIAGGFVAYRYHERGIRQETEESLKEIYQATLSLLYKLLFLLYAEARGLLPMTNPSYREQSLTALARWAAERLDKALPLSDATHATAKYDALLALFHRVDRGDPSLGIPRYNGGLFNPASPENRFLEEHKLSDRVVARAVDALMRDAGQPVDYAYISVRNLGAIYEGLLENKLRVVDAAAGKVELVNDKGERKASGSYYTPDYIVQYIVQHTLEPILDERQARFEAAMDRCADLRRQLRRTSDTTTILLLRQQLDEAERDAREAFLGIKVCDPAMGSGHFLVNAVDYLTDGIIQRMQTYHDDHPDVPWDWNPIQQLIERVRGEILAEMERQGIVVDPDRLDDTALLTRLVMKRCIYGVDLNRLAVELAKLSLWLHSFTVGAPLSFLDHHLRWGNSLLGTDVRTVEQAIQATGTGQLALFAGPFAGLLDLTALMLEVAGQADATLADVQRSAETFEQFQKQLTPYKQMLDLWVSQYFGNKAAREFLTLYGDDVLPALRGERQVADQYRDAIEQARALWREKRFFHWDLEFPEVFVDLHKKDWARNPGFDAVIGNPPYRNAWAMTKEMPADRKAIFELLRSSSVLEGHWDLYIAFVVRALQLCRRDGYQSFILPNPVLREKYAVSLRRGWLTEHSLRRILSFGEANVFDEVSRQCIVYVIQRSVPSSGISTTVETVSEQDEQLRLAAFSVEPGVWLHSYHSQIRISSGYLSGIPLVAKIDSQSVKLGQRLYVNVGATVSSKEPGDFDKRDVVSRSPQGNAQRFFDGADVARWEIDWQGEYLDYRRDEMSGPRVPELFEAEKIVIRIRTGEGERLIAAYDDTGMYCDHTVIICCYYEAIANSGAREDFVGYDRISDPLSLKFILSLLNSRLVSWYFRHEFATGTLQGSYSDVWPQSVRAFPIYRITFITPTDARQRYAERWRRLYGHFCTRNDVAGMRRFVAHHLDAGRSDVVHDLLAFLAERMIAMHKEKQGHLRAFRLDLAGHLDEKHLRKLNRLYTPKKPPKEGIRSYARRLASYEQAVRLAQAQLGSLAGETLNLDDFWRLNQAQWMWLLRQRLGRVTNMSDLVAVYEQYRAQLAPLMRRIQRTDWLIDQVVYQLYGLTEEEIAIVEGC